MTDRALTTARAMLTQVCECGHFNDEHAAHRTRSGGLLAGPHPDACQRFTPASLVVTRPTKRKRR